MKKNLIAEVESVKWRYLTKITTTAGSLRTHSVETHHNITDIFS